MYGGTKVMPCEIYCRLPARRGLRKTALAPGSDETRASDLLVRQTTKILWRARLTLP